MLSQRVGDYDISAIVREIKQRLVRHHLKADQDRVSKDESWRALSTPELSRDILSTIKRLKKRQQERQQADVHHNIGVVDTGVLDRRIRRLQEKKQEKKPADVQPAEKVDAEALDTGALNGRDSLLELIKGLLDASSSAALTFCEGGGAGNLKYLLKFDHGKIVHASGHGKAQGVSGPYVLWKILSLSQGSYDVYQKLPSSMQKGLPHGLKTNIDQGDSNFIADHISGMIMGE